jgi:hypothetical protein
VAGTAVDLVLDPIDAGGPGWSAAAVRLAEELVSQTQGVPMRAVRVAGLMPSGRPVAAVADGRCPPSVSIAHVPGLIGAAVATDRTIGLDIVDLGDAGPALDCFFATSELSLPSDDPALQRARLWSAKEAAYKAACVDEPFQPRRTLVTNGSGDRFSWSLATPGGSVDGQGLWLRVGERIIALASAGGVGPTPGAGDAGPTFMTGGRR